MSELSVLSYLCNTSAAVLLSYSVIIACWNKVIFEKCCVLLINKTTAIRKKGSILMQFVLLMQDTNCSRSHFTQHIKQYFVQISPWFYHIIYIGRCSLNISVISITNGMG